MSEPTDPDVQIEIALRGAFAPHRPEPGAFERRVRERIRERANEPRVETGGRSRLVRWAAGLLPPDLGLALLSKPGGILCALALPVLVVASGLAAFVAGKRSIERSAREAVPPTAPEPQGKWNEVAPPASNWSRAMRAFASWAFLPLVLGPLLFGGAHAFDLLALLLLGSMGLLAWQVRVMARTGLLRRGTVARLCCGLLTSVYTMCFLWAGSFQLVDGRSSIGPSASAGLLLIAIVACAYVMWREGALSGSKAIQPVLWCAFVFLLLSPYTSTSNASYLRRFVERFHADVWDLTDWEEIGHAGETLAAVGEVVPDLTHVRATVARAIESSGALHPEVWTTASRLGLVDREHWTMLAASEAYELNRLLAGTGKLNTTSYYEYLFPMLLATRELSDAEREHLSERIEASWPREPQHGRIEVADTCMRLWTILDRPDRIDAHRDDARSILAQGWIPGNEHRLFARIGGFTSNPEKFRTSFDGTTYAALHLATFVGMPAEVDPFLLRGHLRAESERFSRWIEGSTHLLSDSHAARLRLEREIGLPHRSWIENLLAERILIATSLTLLLCLVALRAAPSRSELERRALA